MQTKVDFTPASLGLIFHPGTRGVGGSGGCWGEHVSPACIDAASAGLPSLQPLQMIILLSPKQIKALPSLPIILMDFMLLFKLRCFQT